MKAGKFFSLLTLAVAIAALSMTGCRKDSPRKIKKNHRQSVGSSAKDLLSNSDYTSLIVEIQYMSGYKPTDAAMTNLKNFLEARLNKSDGISFKYTEINAGGKSSYSLDDVKQLENNNRTQFTSKKQLAAYFLFLDGPYSGNTSDGSVLGIAYYNTSMVIFEKTIMDLTGGFGEPEQYKVETTVIDHEFGHILGLVNLGSAMQTDHQDTPHGQHCTNQNCLMFWEAESGGVIDNLLGNSPIPTLDANCLSDLQANGGK